MKAGKQGTVAVAERDVPVGGGEPKGKAKASRKTEVEPIFIPAPDFRTMQLTLVGSSPFICNKFSTKVIQQMLDKQMKKATGPKPAKDPDADFKNALYPLPGKPDHYGFPAGAFKKAAVRACAQISGVTMSTARAAFQVIGSAEGNLVEIEGDAPIRRMDPVRLNDRARTADIRFRAEFSKWRVTLAIYYNAQLITPEQLVNLYRSAGFYPGVGEWRPEKDGTFGMFTVGDTRLSRGR